MRPTLKDVAELAGVNFTLVSKFLNGDPHARMKPETRERIRRAVETLRYRPSAPARALRSGRSRIVGMVSGDLTNAFWAHFAGCAMRCLKERGYQLLLAVRDSDATPEPLEFLVDRGADGIIISGADLPGNLTLPCPVVVHDTCASGRDAVNPDIAPALDRVLGMVRGRIAALLPENSVWNGVFPAAAARRGLDAAVCGMPLAPEKRPERLREVCRSAPEWLLASGWHTLTQLRELLVEEFPAYRPKIIACANCRGEFLNAPGIACAVAFSSSELIRELCALLLGRIENGGVSTGGETRLIPCRCLDAGSREFEKLRTRGFCLT